MFYYSMWLLYSVVSSLPAWGGRSGEMLESGSPAEPRLNECTSSLTSVLVTRVTLVKESLFLLLHLHSFPPTFICNTLLQLVIKYFFCSECWFLFYFSLRRAQISWSYVFNVIKQEHSMSCVQCIMLRRCAGYSY